MTEPRDQSVPAARDPYPTVLEVGTTLAASLDLDEVVQTIARQVGEALDVQWCDINEYDPVARTFTYTAVWSEALRGVDLDYLGTVISLDDRPERDAVIRKGELLETYVDDPDLDERERAVMIEYDEKAVMEVPLVFGGEVLGVLGVVENRRDRHFTEEEKELLRLLAGPAATALGNARLYRAQQEQARRLAALLDASRALAASVDLDEVLAGVARVAADVSGAAYSTVYEYRPRHDALVFRASHSRQLTPRYVADDPLGTAYPLADWPGERAILEGSAAVQEHVSDGGVARDRQSSMEAWGQKTCLSLPLRAAGEAQGILRLGTLDEERRFTAEELELLEALAEVASAAIHNARLFRAQGEESERLLELFEVSRRLSSAFDRAAVVEALEETAPAGCWPAAAGAPASGCATRTAGSRPPARTARSPASWCCRRSPARRVAEVAGPERSGLAVPLVVRDIAEGVVVVEAQGHRSFSLGEREALQVLANQAAAALENERLYRRAEQEAIRDGLTGLYNHRHFQERLLQECRRARRYGMPLSLLMIDLDDFKGFNDQFGHQIGDEALREVGQILFAVTRRGVDIAARYGGEEFAVILPHTPAGLSPREGAPETGDDPGGAAAGRAPGRWSWPSACARRSPSTRSPGTGAAATPGRRPRSAWPSCATARTPRSSSPSRTRPSTRASVSGATGWSSVATDDGSRAAARRDRHGRLPSGRLHAGVGSQPGHRRQPRPRRHALRGRAARRGGAGRVGVRHLRVPARGRHPRRHGALGERADRGRQGVARHRVPHVRASELPAHARRADGPGVPGGRPGHHRPGARHHGAVGRAQRPQRAAALPGRGGRGAGPGREARPAAVHLRRPAACWSSWPCRPPWPCTPRACSAARRSRRRRLGALLSASRAMTSTIDLDDLLRTICHEARVALDTDECAIDTFDPDAGTLTMVALEQRVPQPDWEHWVGQAYSLDEYRFDRRGPVRGGDRGGARLRPRHGRDRTAPR